MKKRIIATGLIFALLISFSGAVYAKSDTISQTIYAILDNAGTPKNIILTYNDKEEKNISGELPFIVNISYYHNKLKVNPQDMLGKSGDINISFDIKSNIKAKDYYKENLALQMQFPIDTEANTHITTKGLSGVTVGATKTFSGIVLPGNSAKFDVSYKTESFELDSTNFVCMPLDIGNMANIDISSISSDVSKLQAGISSYVDGVEQLNTNYSQILQGSKQLSISGSQLNSGYTQMTGGQQQLMNAMLATMPKEMKATFAPQVEAIAQGQKKYSDNLTQYTQGISQSSKGMEQFSGGLIELSKQGITIKSGVNSAIAPLSSMVNPIKPSTPVSFLSDETISDIQFVMKTDGLSIDTIKSDVTAVPKPKTTFWDRLVAIFKK